MQNKADNSEGVGDRVYRWFSDGPRAELVIAACWRSSRRRPTSLRPPHPFTSLIAEAR
jgi:hypothetical protein